MDPSQLSSAFSFEDASQEIIHPLVTPSEYSSYSQPLIETECIKVIWGTNINVYEVSEKIKEFIRTKYLEEVNQLVALGLRTFSVDCEYLPEELKKQLIYYPKDMIPIFENSLQEIVNEMNPDSSTIRIKFYNIGEIISILNIDEKFIDKIVRVEGLVIRVSNVLPELVRGFYKCDKCSKELIIDNLTADPNCECSRFTMKLIENKSIYKDKQFVKIQPMDGQACPITIVAYGNLVDSIIPGDRVSIVGILKADSIKLSINSSKFRSNFRVWIEMLSHTSLFVSKKPDIDIKLVQFDEKMISRVQEVRNSGQAYEILSGMIAPSIYGMENVKKALLLQLFGGVRKERENMKLRGDINILLTGDPGISKSQLLSFINRISRGIYTSGKGSSAVGLSATVMKKDGFFVLEPGALVLSDNGICCIDEFDKMSDNTRSVLHEVMEQQSVTVAKAGIITTLNARCSILASCNPKESKYNSKKSIVENINIPPTLMSRFDVVALLIDKSDEDNDRAISEHILSLYVGDVKYEDPDNIEFLRFYIEEAKKISPKLTNSSEEILKNFYCELRQLDNGKSITATTRQLESLIRLSEAHARVRLSDSVEEVDAKEAIRIVKESLMMYAIDPVTGKIDMDLIISGKSTHRKKLLEDLKSEILKNLRTKTKLKDLVEKTNSDERSIREAIMMLENEDLVYFDKREQEVERIKM